MYFVLFTVLHRCSDCVVKNGPHVSNLWGCKVSLTVSLKMNQSCLRSCLIQEKSSTTWRLQVKRLSVTKVRIPPLTEGVTGWRACDSFVTHRGIVHHHWYCTTNSAVTGHRPSGFGRKFSVISCHRQLWASECLSIKKSFKKIKLYLNITKLGRWLNSKFCPLGHRSHPRLNWLKWYSIL